jgi:hypothetical protein
LPQNPVESDLRDLGRPTADRTDEGIWGDVAGASGGGAGQPCWSKKMSHVQLYQK